MLCLTYCSCVHSYFIETLRSFCREFILANFDEIYRKIRTETNSLYHAIYSCSLMPKCSSWRYFRAWSILLQINRIFKTFIMCLCNMSNCLMFVTISLVTFVFLRKSLCLNLCLKSQEQASFGIKMKLIVFIYNLFFFIFAQISLISIVFPILKLFLGICLLI